MDCTNMPLIITLLVITVILLLIRLYTVQVIWFYRPDCGYCAKMKPAWDAVEAYSHLTLFPRIDAVKININEPENEKLADNYEVRGVPLIVKVGYLGTRDVYKGDRTPEDIIKWIYQKH